MVAFQRSTNFQDFWLRYYKKNYEILNNNEIFLLKVLFTVIAQPNSVVAIFPP